jgi:protein-arginine deiminase
MGQGLQPPVVLDTDWLLVGHVDETTHVVRGDNQGGWTLMVADPRIAARLLRQAQAAGAGGIRLFPGYRTVEGLVGDEAVMSANDRAASHIDAQLDTMLAATGLRRSEIVRVPVLTRHPGTEGDALIDAVETALRRAAPAFLREEGMGVSACRRKRG